MKALIKIQAELKAPKNQFNGFGKYKYRSCEDILEAVKPLCVRENALLTISDTIEVHNNRMFVKATATFKTESFEHTVTALAAHPETKKGMDDSQVTGAASSYARKYALNGLFCIDDTKDDDTGDNKNNDRITNAITEVNNCKTKEDLQKVWSKYKGLQTNAAFVKAKDIAKSKVQ